jgi:hypothetical protein
MGTVFFLAGLWRWRFSILVMLVLAAIPAVKLYIDHVKGDQAKAALAMAAQINKENVETLNQIKLDRALAERILGDRIARKSKEADRLGDLVQHILSQERTNACAASPSVRALLDRLRTGDGSAKP